MDRSIPTQQQVSLSAARKGFLSRLLVAAYLPLSLLALTLIVGTQVFAVGLGSGACTRCLGHSMTLKLIATTLLAMFAVALHGRGLFLGARAACGEIESARFWRTAFVGLAFSAAWIVAVAWAGWITIDGTD